MSMSHGARSAGLIGLPRFAPAPNTTPGAGVSETSADTRTALCIRMCDLPFLVDRPARDPVVMMVLKRQQRRYRRQLAARCDELRPRRLRVAVLVPSAALQNGRTAVPLPGHAKARERHAQHRLLQRRLAPALAAVGGDQNLGNPAFARISEAGNLVKAWLLQRQSRRRFGDEGFDLVDEVELERFSARQ